MIYVNISLSKVFLVDYLPTVGEARMQQYLTCH